MAFYTQKELEKIGFKSLGNNVKVSKLASFYNPGNIEIGDNSRVDDFCVLSAGVGGLSIGRYVHISVYASIIGAGKVTLEDFTCISGRCSIYSSNDDYSGAYMTNPTVPSEYTNVTHAPVTIKKHSLVGAGSIVLPGVEIGEGSAVGSLSLVNKSLEAGFIYVGNPAKKLRKRKSTCKDLEKLL
ncbi:acyltransferase [Thalassotalea ponticola]|uniref:acyltransferase n=1 Tax=Thalassotalea ponticola TaxID=1523392 RepID=UPI0025B3CF2F|nr:acyltransferase [Thalassotalea ponticola]MDN3652649.1 acyltransferase [Thalassotalea ponticola]